jgi:hypothetical protein
MVKEAEARANDTKRKELEQKMADLGGARIVQPKKKAKAKSKQ